MQQLKSLQTVASFRLSTCDVQNTVDEFGTFRVVSLGPVVSCTGLRLPEHDAKKVVDEVQRPSFVFVDTASS